MSIASILTGRATIGITGYYKGSKETVDIDVSTEFSGNYPANITSHPIEKDPSAIDDNLITDHIEVKPASVTLRGILSDATTLGVVTETAKEKFKKLTGFQRSGVPIKVEGYGTGGLVGKILSFIGSALGLFNADISDPFYIGFETDVIENLAIGNISFARSTNLGKNIEVTISLQRVMIAVAQTGSRTRKAQIGGVAGAAGKTAASAVPGATPVKSSLKAGV